MEPSRPPAGAMADRDSCPNTKSTRSALIQLASAFVGEAIRVRGVTRIALVGSITTTKPDPKDIDLLVSIEDGTDLAPLAVRGRRLKGMAQSLGKGADIFLADTRGHYLGRICEWRDCRPGVRVRCDALHCGRRPYLHDDLVTVRLSDSIIGNPPIVLWPELARIVPVPPGVQRGLLRPLQKQSANRH